jgi:hypothetical protein
MANILAVRLMGLADLCVGVLVAAFVAHLASVRAVWRWLGLALLALGLFLIVPSPLPLQSESYSIPSYFTGNAVKRISPGSTALVAPFATTDESDDPQIWQAASGFRFRMAEGYVYEPSPTGPISGPIPNPLSEEMNGIFAAPPGSTIPQVSSTQRAVYLADLSTWRVTTVLVGPMPNYKLMVGFFQNLFGHVGSHQGGVTAWYNVRS